MSTWQEQAATCTVGDPDPLPFLSADEECCGVAHHGWFCTLAAGHTTQHVAGTFVSVAAVWPVTA